LRLYDARSFKYDGPGESIPVTFGGNHPHVDAEVRLGDGATIKGRMVVDVGSSASLALTKPFVESNHLRDRVGKTIRRRSGGGVGGPVTADIGRVAALKLGRLEIERPITSLQGDSAGVMSGNAEWIGNIGGDILRRFTVFLDYANKRMILEPHAGANEPSEADMSGLMLVMNDSLSAATVDYVVPGSAATDAGLVVGDTLVTIDGQPANGSAVREFRKRLRRDGERIVLTVRRGGAVRTVTLVLRRLV
jgi:membrane-associated protease RseP (regulator of RpoE activity)